MLLVDLHNIQYTILNAQTKGQLVNRLIIDYSCHVNLLTKPIKISPRFIIQHSTPASVTALKRVSNLCSTSKERNDFNQLLKIKEKDLTNSI